jgi:hypothetical protein
MSARVPTEKMYSLTLARALKRCGGNLAIEAISRHVTSSTCRRQFACRCSGGLV